MSVLPSVSREICCCLNKLRRCSSSYPTVSRPGRGYPLNLNFGADETEHSICVAWLPEAELKSALGLRLCSRDEGMAMTISAFVIESWY